MVDCERFFVFDIGSTFSNGIDNSGSLFEPFTTDSGTLADILDIDERLYAGLSDLMK